VKAGSSPNTIGDVSRVDRPWHVVHPHDVRTEQYCRGDGSGTRHVALVGRAFAKSRGEEGLAGGAHENRKVERRKLRKACQCGKTLSRLFGKAQARIENQRLAA